MVYLLRASDTTKIQNSDDIRAFRYATCGINGVVANRLNQLGYEINGTNFVLKSGEIIVDAWQVKVDATGETITLDTSSGTRYYSVYVEVDLSVSSNKHASILSTYATFDYPTIDKGDDLSVVDSGIARLELYRFEVVDNVIQNVQAKFELLDGKVDIARYASDDKSKGTIEERLTRLGFKEGSISLNTEYSATLESGTPSIDGFLLKRQGNYVIGRLDYTVTGGGFTMNPSGVIANLPKEFWPKEEYTPDTLTMYLEYTSNGFSRVDQPNNIVFRTNGEIYLKAATQSYYAFSFGYEANPL